MVSSSEDIQGRNLPKQTAGFGPVCQSLFNRLTHVTMENMLNDHTHRYVYSCSFCVPGDPEHFNNSTKGVSKVMFQIKITTGIYMIA